MANKIEKKGKQLMLGQLTLAEALSKDPLALALHIARTHWPEATLFHAPGTFFCWLYANEGAQAALATTAYDAVLFPPLTRMMSAKQVLEHPFLPSTAKNFTGAGSLLAMVEGQMVTLQGEAEPVMAIRLMATRPQYRKQGLMRHLIQAALNAYPGHQLGFVGLSHDGTAFMKQAFPQARIL